MKNIQNIFIVILFIFTNCKNESIEKKEFPLELKRQLKYFESSLDSLHQIKPNPIDGEWLYAVDEKGQTFEEYFNSNPSGITNERYKLYIQPIGNLSNTEKAVIILTAEYLSIYYNLPIEINNPIAIDVIPDSVKRNHQGYEQLDAKYILNNILKPKLPDDAVSYIAFTASDLYKKGNNFLFGLGSNDRVGVCSFARYGNPDESINSYKLFLSRITKLASHELGHMIGIKHCIKYECVMNGSLSLHENDSKPYSICPEDLLKICWNMEIDAIYRYQSLYDFWNDNGFPEKAAFYKKSIASLKANAYRL